MPISPSILNVSKTNVVDLNTIAPTKLTAAEQVEFEKWKSKLPTNLQHEGDYDLKGLWKSNPNVKPSANLHFPDTYKLPNHPTFSDESIYFNPNTKKYAGKWQETDNSWDYIPYDENYKKPIIEKKIKLKVKNK